jgi:glucose/mannose-6-phosphate isomerase
MNLDVLGGWGSVDVSGMLVDIENLGYQLIEGWQLGNRLAMPASAGEVDLIVVVGMGGSAYAANIAVSAILPDSRTPVLVIRGYDLPSFVRGRRVLVIGSSYSGDTEETLFAVKEAVARSCRVMVLTTGGELLRYALDRGLVSWTFEFDGQPRAALGWVVGLLLRLFEHLELTHGMGLQVMAAAKLVHDRRTEYAPYTPLETNKAKQLAMFLVEHVAVVYGADPLDWVALRWRNQILENAKASAQYDVLPELNHNAIAGIVHPAELGKWMRVVILSAAEHYHPRVAARVGWTADLLKQREISVEVVELSGTCRLAVMMAAITLGDYVSFYLAMYYKEDPSPIQPITEFKHNLAALSAV